jgi:hypothetical protein
MLLTLCLFQLTDVDCENSSDSGFSISSSEIPSEPVFPRVGILLPLFCVEFVPIQLLVLCYLPINEAPDQQVSPVQSKHQLIKWSLPPPSPAPVALPGWNPMP